MPAPWKPADKDTFHNLIFCIDKKYSWCIVNATSPINFLPPKGVVDGERPLKFSLPNWVLIRNLDLYFYPASKDVVFGIALRAILDTILTVI